MLRWEHLRAIGNSPIVRATVVVPVAGYFILLSEQIARFAELDPRLAPLASGFPWRLAATYFGLTSIAIGSVTYSLGCPQIVRRYESAVDYDSAEHAFWFVRAHFQKKITDVARLAKQRGGSVEGMPYDNMPPLDKSAATAALATSQTTVALTLEWHLANTSRGMSLWIAGIFFGLGAAILAIPTTVTLYQVTVSVIKAVAGWLSGTPV